MLEKQVRSLCWEDPLHKETATHSRILGNPRQRNLPPIPTSPLKVLRGSLFKQLESQERQTWLSDLKKITHSLKNTYSREFPSDPVLGLGSSTAEGPGSIPGQGTMILQAESWGKWRKRKEGNYESLMGKSQAISSWTSAPNILDLFCGTAGLRAGLAR